MTTRRPGKPYNGLKQPPNLQIPFGGQVHNLAQRTPTPEEMKAAMQDWLDEQMQGLAKTIFVQVAAKQIGDADIGAAWISEEFQEFARSSMIAAQAFFEAKGFKFESPADDAAEVVSEQPPDGE